MSTRAGHSDKVKEENSHVLADSPLLCGGSVLGQFAIRRRASTTVSFICPLLLPLQRVLFGLIPEEFSFQIEAGQNQIPVA
jgi:hypothetical protein